MFRSVRHSLMSSTALLSVAAACALIALQPPRTAHAAGCSVSGSTTTCDAANSATATVGAGNSPAGDYQTVVVEPSGFVRVGDENAISLRDNASIEVKAGGVISASGTTLAGGNYVNGQNTIEFRNGGTLIVRSGGLVTSQGSQINAEGVNLQGIGNTIQNFGTISATNAAPIWFDNGSTAASTNTVINEVGGLIQAATPTSNAIGEVGGASLVFTNRGTVQGNLRFGSGDDTLNLKQGRS